jgi:hypothetical protein
MIKLILLDELDDGTQRFQSQLMVGRITADFIRGTDNIMCCYGRLNGSMGFYPYKEPYVIVSDKDEMRIQEL